MLLFDAPLTLREFMTHEPLPLATLFHALLTFLRDRQDAVLFGAQAVNAYCDEERMTHDVDVLSTDPAALAEAIRAHLSEKFAIAVRTREVAQGSGFRVYQARKPKNRRLVDVRGVSQLPPYRETEGVRVVEPAELLAMKVISLSARKGQAKADTDQADIKRLLLAFPELRSREGLVMQRLVAHAASDEIIAAWSSIAATAPVPDEQDTY